MSRTAFSPDPEQRYLFVAEQVMVLERESLRPLSRFGRVGDRPGEFYVLHDMVSDPDGNLIYGRGECGGSRPEVHEYRTAPAGPM